MYHGRLIGNMVAVSRDSLLLNWEKLTGYAVIPYGADDEPSLPYKTTTSARGSGGGGGG